MNGLVDRPRFAKTHLNFGRMHVHIDLLRADFDKKHIAGLALTVQHIVKGRTHRMGDEFVPHKTTVDVNILLVGA